MSELGELLRAARTAAGLSLSAIAARSNYSKPYLGQLETGLRQVKPEHVAAYELVFGPIIWVEETMDRRGFTAMAAGLMLLPAGQRLPGANGRVTAAPHKPPNQQPFKERSPEARRCIEA